MSFSSSKKKKNWLKSNLNAVLSHTVI